MPAEKSELEEAIKFGMSLSSVQDLLTHNKNIFNSSIFPEDTKRELAGDLNRYRELAQGVITNGDTLYSGIPLVERINQNLRETLREMEQAAKPYL